MAKVFMSFLGTNKYLHCNYVYKDRRIENVTFVQEALLQLFCLDFEPHDRIVIFLTKDAEKTNWQPTNGDVGLKDIIDRIVPDIQTIVKRIPEGISENEIWDIFNIIYESIDKNDEILFDITHGFRSLPILGITLLNYARFLKNIKVRGIYYGAFEVLGSQKYVSENIPLSERDAPIFDLTSFDTLQQWSIAVDNFVEYGISENIAHLIHDNLKPLLIESKGKDPQALIEREMAKALNKISYLFRTVRGNEIVNGIDFIDANRLFERLEDGILVNKPLMPLISSIKDKIGEYKSDDIMNGFRAVRWCIDHHLTQQGITLLQETIITYLLIRIEENPKNLENRASLSELMNFHNNKLPEDTMKRNSKMPVIAKKIEGNELYNKITPLYNSLRNHRNDINHGGYKIDKDGKNPMKAEEFEKKLKIVYEEVIGVIHEG